MLWQMIKVPWEAYGHTLAPLQCRFSTWSTLLACKPRGRRPALYSTLIPPSTISSSIKHVTFESPRRVQPRSDQGCATARACTCGKHVGQVQSTHCDHMNACENDFHTAGITSVKVMIPYTCYDHWLTATCRAQCMYSCCLSPVCVPLSPPYAALLQVSKLPDVLP